MSNKLRSFLIVVISIAVVMAALPLNALQVYADGECHLEVETNDSSKGTVWIENDNGDTNITSGDYQKNDVKTLHAKPSEGCILVRWVFDGTDQSTLLKTNEITSNFTLTGANHTVKAIFGTACDFSAVSNIDGAGTIEFDGDFADDKSYVNGEVTLKAVPNTGYKFVGWKTSESDSTVSTDNPYVVTVTGNSSYIACFESKTHTISFDINVPEGSNVSGEMADEVVEEGAYTITRNQFTYAGHYFTGWKIDGDDTLIPDHGNITVGESDITLRAQWHEGWNIYFNSNGGEGIMSPVGYDEKPAEYPAPDTSTFTRTGYVLYGWRLDDPNTGYIFTPGVSVITVNGDCTLYAIWAREITFHANGGTESDTHQTITVGSNSVALDANTFAAPEEGKVFLGWSRTADGTIQYQDKCVVSITGVDSTDVKDLYAQWGTTCTVKFDANDSAYYGTAGGSMSDAEVGIGFTTALPTCGFTRAGHTFAGWEDPSVTGVTVKADNSITIDSTYSGEPITLKAKWAPSTHTVTFKDEDGSLIASTTYNYGVVPTPAVPTKSPTKESVYTFDGWKDTSTENTVYKDGLPAVTSAATYQATYAASPRPYTVSVSVTDTAGGSVEASSTKNYGEEATITVDLQYGYHIEKWKITSGDTVVTKEIGDVSYTFTVEGTTEVIVEIAKNPYTVTVTSSEGGTASAPTGLVYGDEAQLSVSPSNGYRFVNWTDSAGDEVSTDPNYKFTVMSDVTLNANFTLLSYDISLSSGEHGSVSGGDTYKHSESITVTATPDKGYHFVNWTENGTEVSTDSEYTFTVTGARNLKANFEINMYTVTYKNDDGTVLQESEMPFGSTASYQHMANPTKKPTAQYTYTFAGWDNDTTLVTKDITYTAVYTSTVNKYKITFTNEDGTVLQTSEVEYGKFPVYEKDTPTKSATVDETFTFAGWDKEISKVTGETVYKATYTSKPIAKDSINYKYFTVAFVTNGGSEIVSQLVAEGGVAFKPEEPLRERYTFGGWYIDAALTKPFSFATVITSDITLYAKWIKGSPEIEATYAVVGMGSTTVDLNNAEDITVEIERSKDNDSIGSHFKGVLIDGVEVDYYNYELAEDNSSVIIRADAFDGLEAGEHTITIVYDDGTAEVELIVADGDEPVKITEEVVETETGNETPVEEPTVKPNNTALWIALAAVAGLVVIAIPIFIVIKRRGVK